jgi:hypothetical protein
VTKAGSGRRILNSKAEDKHEASFKILIHEAYASELYRWYTRYTQSFTAVWLTKLCRWELPFYMITVY